MMPKFSEYFLSFGVQAKPVKDGQRIHHRVGLILAVDAADVERYLIAFLPGDHPPVCVVGSAYRMA